MFLIFYSLIYYLDIVLMLSLILLLYKYAELIRTVHINIAKKNSKKFQSKPLKSNLLANTL